jgi:uncharacterized small protein (DUF1192 family)
MKRRRHREEYAMDNIQSKLAEEIAFLKGERERVMRDAQIVYNVLSQEIDRLEAILNPKSEPAEAPKEAA